MFRGGTDTVYYYSGLHWSAGQDRQCLSCEVIDIHQHLSSSGTSNSAKDLYATYLLGQYTLAVYA